MKKPKDFVCFARFDDERDLRTKPRCSEGVLWKGILDTLKRWMFLGCIRHGRSLYSECTDQPASDVIITISQPPHSHVSRDMGLNQ